MSAPKSILSGVDVIIDRWCGLSRRTDCGSGNTKYSNKNSAIVLSDEGLARDAVARGDVIRNLFSRIESNWEAAGRREASSRTWVLRRKLALTDASHSQEVTLERFMIQSLGGSWSNQLATCSGLVKKRREGRRSVDLVHDLGEGRFEFIELKYRDGARGDYGSQNPLYAAWEIVAYGLLYLLARRHLQVQGDKPVLAAREISLKVLAPAKYYQYRTKHGSWQAFELEWLEKFLDQSLSALCKDSRFRMTFEFQQFTEVFDSVYDPSRAPPALPRDFQRAGPALREPVYGGK